MAHHCCQVIVLYLERMYIQPKSSTTDLGKLVKEEIHFVCIVQKLKIQPFLLFRRRILACKSTHIKIESFDLIFKMTHRIVNTYRRNTYLAKKKSSSLFILSSFSSDYLHRDYRTEYPPAKQLNDGFFVDGRW